MSPNSNRILFSNAVQRVLTGIILGLMILFILKQESALLFLIFLSLASVLAAYEWAHTVDYQHVQGRIFYTFITACLTALLFALTQHFSVITMLSIAIFYILVSCVIIILEERGIPQKLNVKLIWRIGGLIIIPSSSVALLSIFQIDPMCFTVFLLVVCGIDTFCYVGGKLLGKTLFVPTVSPNKTVEGLLVGFFAGLLILYLLNHFFIILRSEIFISVYLVLFLSAIIGDLNISVMKRKFRKKNTGWIFPGHGGVLDRADSILYAAPCFLIALSLFKRIQ